MSVEEIQNSILESIDNIFDFVKSNFDNSDCLRVDLDIDGYTLHNL